MHSPGGEKRGGADAASLIVAAGDTGRYAQINMDVRLELDSDDIGFLAMMAAAVQ